MEISLQDLQALLRSGGSHSIQVGKQYLIRTVTYFYTGIVTAVTDTDIVLSDAAWIADTGRFTSALTSGELSEVEPFVDDVLVARGGVIDLTEWRHQLPRAQK